MDLAVTLIKSVMRAFYPTRDILVVDALILHETLRDDDLAYLMAINTKDLHKICGKLREDRFLTVHTRQELRPGNPRPSNRTWYYINYRHTIDAIKWRVYTIDKEVQGSSVAVNEKKEYFCTFCKAEWTAMEVLDNVGPNGFLCHRCHHTLTFEADRNSGGHEQSTRLNDQFKFIGELLPKIDVVHIPECDFDRALAKARPVVRDATHQRAATIPVDAGANRPMAVKGLTNTGPQSIAVNISTAEGPSEIEKEAERARKEKIARQNALPAWMSNSTVTGESFAGVADTSAATAKKEVAEDASRGRPEDSSTIAQIDDIFEKLKADQAVQRAREENGGGDEEFGSEEEDDEDEFEDVPREGEPLNGLDASGERVAKRAKMEPGLKMEGGIGEDGGDDEEDEEVEFEDV
ncbi:TFIIE alpha subunit domain-containing protein [Hirsutella rhossiliensis]|uniref:TFIIE alpha subunit domain-containing protein n=1 Tax=Hirsutella rhossiliensis TaxID=111463 RepID=A0A9P8MYK3_9HYPO|nr:TFIIE alpha subunit domain-containing protein [Hirsutella rhossiliensis]KAH0964423.1 TFIIE alpha subunit domain-containing protein [Hirsutella rhossiliensis]